MALALALAVLLLAPVLAPVLALVLVFYLDQCVRILVPVPVSVPGICISTARDGK